MSSMPTTQKQLPWDPYKIRTFTGFRKLANRRFALIDRRWHGTITSAETRELERITRAVREYLGPRQTNPLLAKLDQIEAEIRQLGTASQVP